MADKAGTMDEIQPTPAARQAEDIHICPSCSSSFVIPVDWAPSTGGRWVVHLRCPECEWTGGGTYSQNVVDRYDETLDSGTEAVLQDLMLLSRANMEEYVQAFAAALWSDRILPEDF
ncbi:MAG: hypothetical protein ABI726_00500 [bacterium]